MSRYSDLTDEQREELRAQRAEQSAFSDHKLAEATAAAYLRVTGAEMRKLLAEGRATLWAEDVKRYRDRRDGQPQLGKWWPPLGKR